MKAISGHTKISTLIKENPAALEAIISLSPKFNKLRNPLLRKLMAGRTSIDMASKLGGCSVDDFFNKLEPLGFTIDKTTFPKVEKKDEKVKAPTPAFMNNNQAADLGELDVRPLLNAGQDPLNLILKTIKQLKPGQVLKLVNSFEPTPLLLLLGKQGFESYVETIDENLVHTFFHKTGADPAPLPVADGSGEGWDEILKRFENKLETIDVRHLEMPQPMLNILDALNKLEPGMALYVIHKRIPVFLLPELAQRNLEYRIKEMGEGEVRLLIFAD